MTIWGYWEGVCVTVAALPKDSMARSLNGTTKWERMKGLQRLGETRIGGYPSNLQWSGRQGYDDLPILAFAAECSAVFGGC
jgi:hypothetical protein